MNDEEKERVKKLVEEWIKKVEPKYHETIELEKNKPAYRELLNRFESRYYFFMGLTFGILFGILGNFLSTHWIELLKSIGLSQQDWIKVNIVFFFGFLVAIIFCVLWIRARLRNDKNTIDKAWLEIVTSSIFKTHVSMPEELKQLLNKDEDNTSNLHD